MPKVSIIVPVYGVEKYIERCARSLFEQTLDDIEYLFIDDCTPDESIVVLMRVLDEYPQRQSQVKIHRMEKNSGQAKVREWGMKNATGEYVIHCDSDDWVDKGMYLAMYDKAQKENSDVIISDFFEFDGKSTKNKIKGCENTEVSLVIDDILLRKVHGALWNKMFRRDRVSCGMVFPKGNLWEDMAIVIQLLLVCDKVSYIPEPYYYYCYNPGSILNSHHSKEKNIRNFLSERDNLNVITDSLSSKSLLYIYSNDIIDLKFHTLHLLFPYVNDKDCYKLMLLSYPNMKMAFLFSHHATIKYKIYYLLALMRIYPFIWKVLKKH